MIYEEYTGIFFFLKHLHFLGSLNLHIENIIIQVILIESI